MTRKFAAWLNLAWHFARHTTRLPLRPFRRGRDLLRFGEAVAKEGYVPLDPTARTEFPSYMNCVHCGLCALACVPQPDRSASAWQEAWTFVAGASRSLATTPLVARDLTECALSSAAERACPMGIPIRHMAATIHRMADQ